MLGTSRLNSYVIATIIFMPQASNPSDLRREQNGSCRTPDGWPLSSLYDKQQKRKNA